MLATARQRLHFRDIACRECNP